MYLHKNRLKGPAKSLAAVQVCPWHNYTRPPFVPALASFRNETLGDDFENVVVEGYRLSGLSLRRLLGRIKTGGRLSLGNVSPRCKSLSPYG